jgi:hypothetical protein
VVKFDKVSQFMNHHVVDDKLRGFDEPPIEIQVSFQGA